MTNSSLTDMTDTAYTPESFHAALVSGQRHFPPCVRAAQRAFRRTHPGLVIVKDLGFLGHPDAGFVAELNRLPCWNG